LSISEGKKGPATALYLTHIFTVQGLMLYDGEGRDGGREEGETLHGDDDDDDGGGGGVCPRE